MNVKSFVVVFLVTFIMFNMVVAANNQPTQPDLYLSGESSRVFDPVFLEPGIYEITSTGASDVAGIVVKGSCGWNFTPGDSFTLISGYSSYKSIQHIFSSDGCWVVWSVDSDVPFAVAFDKLD